MGHFACRADFCAPCKLLLQHRIQQSGYQYFRLHPKGRGVVCSNPGGIPAFTFVEEYFGELHTGGQHLPCWVGDLGAADADAAAACAHQCVV